MQNEELRSAQVEIEAGRARYWDLYDLAPVAHWTLSEKGMFLERTGYKVLAAGTPGEAIALGREHAGGIHLLTTDVIMPEMSGWDLGSVLQRLDPQNAEI